MRRVFFLAGLILAGMSPAIASAQGLSFSGSTMITGPAGPPSRTDRAFTLLRSQIIALRQEAIALQARDGGTLTAEHRDAIQERIDAAYQRYYRTRINRPV